MPIYEYKCSTCDFSFEERQGFDADTICVCPQCQNTARRLFRPAPIIFKGKGFYVTDYPSGSATVSQTRAEEETGTVEKKETGAKAESEPALTSKASDDQ